jgi:alpha-mannosidase II
MYNLLYYFFKGYTPTMAYLLKQMGFNGMLVQRVHYHLKKYMGQTRRFEFNWRQGWSSKESKDTSIFTHVMPFYSYDVPHTCGPDPKICCQFDFKRLSQLMCPWGIRPQVINDLNVEERASTLLDQYRKKAQLYGDENNHNAVLVPLGDDFRYSDLNEAHDQFENYERLIKYMNSRKDWNVNVRFGTLREYFELAMKNYEKIDKKVETFSGDFFTYADRQDHYWSGYFTSRAFYKRLDRLVEYYLRSSELVYSVVNLLQSKVENSKLLSASGNLFQLMLTARRNLALFQHHDGITGTSKSHVMLDYAEK